VAWHIVKLDAEIVITDDQKLAGLDKTAVLQAIEATLRAMPQIAGVGPAPAGTPRTHQIGLRMTASWQAVGDDGLPRAIASSGPGGLVVTMEAQAEQRMEQGTPDVARRQVDATVPVSAERAPDMAPFVQERLRRAAEVAIADALGELWARGLKDPEILALLDDETAWRRTAGVREVGERALVEARAKLEEAARGSRKDLAVVAAAALGRLGQAESVEPLIGVLGSIHAEVVDAALLSLSDIGTPPALDAIRDAAANHPIRSIRQRATALLQERAARPGP